MSSKFNIQYHQEIRKINSVTTEKNTCGISFPDAVTEVKIPFSELDHKLKILVENLVYAKRFFAI